MPTAAHFIYIPSMVLLGVVLGWILGSRAAADAYAAESRKQQLKADGRRSEARGPKPEA